MRTKLDAALEAIKARTFQVDSQKRSCLERVRESDRALAELCREMEIGHVHDLAGYTIAVHVRQMLVRVFKSIDETPVAPRAGREE